MRSRLSLQWLYPVLAASLLLALPLSVSRSLRDALSSKLSCLFSSEPTVPSEQEKKELEEWLKERNETKKKTLLETKHILQEIGFSQALIGEVIARPRPTFESFIWINLGADDNPKEGAPCIAKWSPVLSGNAVVGVVEYVGKKSSLIRLISDPELHIAVRVVRGSPERQNTARSIQQLERYLALHTDSFSKPEERTAFEFLLQKLQESLLSDNTSLFLAKGEIHGNLLSPLLEGTGFNYDFPDAKGEARELRSSKVPLVQKGDVLQTSGLDGVFPEGLQVAVVESITPLQEGAFSYELLARPAAEALPDLRTVIVLAPRTEEPLVSPSRADRIRQELP